MKRFFDSITSIDHFTHNLNLHQNTLQCAGCAQSDQFVSHGFVIKFRHNAQPEKVGKRIFCSNRYQHTGCGRTFQLYIASEIPSFQYDAIRLFVFISALFANFSVVSAYQKFTGASGEARHAWRWLNQLMRRLMGFRGDFRTRTQPKPMSLKIQSRKRKLLLPTLKQVFVSVIDCTAYQLHYQRSFM